MNIKGFSVGIDKGKRLRLVILTATVIAVVLITISFVLVYKNKEKSDGLNAKKEIDFSSITSYKAKYVVNIKSNKNQNNYKIYEEYRKEDDGEYFKFEVLTENGTITYTFENNSLSITSTGQNLEYSLNDYLIKKTNVISIATFLELYNNITKNEDDSFSINVEEEDNKLVYSVIKKSDNSNYEFLDDISKLELVVDKEKNTFLEYSVYNANKEAYIDIIYDEFSFLN